MSKINCHFKGEVKQIYIFQNLITFKKKILNDFNENINNVEYLNLTATDNSFTIFFKIENQNDFDSIIYDLNINNIICELNKKPTTNEIIEEKYELREKIKENQNLISKLKRDLDFCIYKYTKTNNLYNSLKKDYNTYQIESKKTFDEFKNILSKVENNSNFEEYDNELNENIIKSSDNENNEHEIIEKEDRFVDNQIKNSSSEKINDDFENLNIIKNNIDKDSNNNIIENNIIDDSEEVNMTNVNITNNNNEYKNINHNLENDYDNNLNNISENIDYNSNFHLMNSYQSQEKISCLIICNKNPIFIKKKKINKKNPINIQVTIKNNGTIPIPQAEIVCDNNPNSNLYIFNTLINNGNNILPDEEINVNLFIYFKNYQNIKTGLNTIFIHLKNTNNELIGEKGKIEIIIQDVIESDSISVTSMIINSLREENNI